MFTKAALATAIITVWSPADAGEHRSYTVTVRVNAQLIDAASGAHLWADRFEEGIADLFKLEDQVVARLANTLGIELVKAESEAGAHSKNPDSVDLACAAGPR